MVSEFAVTGLLNSGLTVASELGLRDCRATDGRAGLRLSAGLLAGRAMGGLHKVRQRRDGIVGSEPRDPAGTPDHVGRSGQRGAAILSGWQAARIRFDVLQRTFSHF